MLDDLQTQVKALNKDRHAKARAAHTAIPDRVVVPGEAPAALVTSTISFDFTEDDASPNSRRAANLRKNAEVAAMARKRREERAASKEGSIRSPAQKTALSSGDKENAVVAKSPTRAMKSPPLGPKSPLSAMSPTKHNIMLSSNVAIKSPPKAKVVKQEMSLIQMSP